MKTLESYEEELRKLRQEHTQAFNAEKFDRMQSIGTKIIHLLNTIVQHFPKWKETNAPGTLKPKTKNHEHKATNHNPTRSKKEA